MKIFKIFIFLVLYLFLISLVIYFKSSFDLNIIYILLFGVLSFVLCILIHELGHLIFGLLSGYKFVSFKILFLKVINQESLKVAIEPFNIMMPGQCLMKPTNRKYIMYNLGGLIFTYIFSIIAIVLYCISTNNILINLYFIFLVINTSLAILNSIYNKYGINDVCNIVKCYKSKDFLEGVLFQLDIVGNITINNKIKSIYNPVDDVGDIISNVTIWTLRYYKAYNEKKFDSMDYYYNLLNKNYNKVYFSILKPSILVLLLNHSFIINRDISKVRKILNKINIKDNKYIKQSKYENKIIEFYKEVIINKREYQNDFFNFLLKEPTDAYEKLNKKMYITLKSVYCAYIRNEFNLIKRG